MARIEADRLLKRSSYSYGVRFCAQSGHQKRYPIAPQNGSCNSSKARQHNKNHKVVAFRKTLMSDENSARDEILVTLTSEIVAAHVSNNNVAVSDLPLIINSVHAAMLRLTGRAEDLPEPAVSIKSSIKPDYIVCLEDGKKLKMLKRHLMTSFQMTPDDYRQRWGLPANYPMVAPNYAKKRRELAKAIGLGKKKRRRS